MNNVTAIAFDRAAPRPAESDVPTPAVLVAIGGIVAALASFLAILATGHLDEDAYM